jgi:formylmethanofuran dehydrogenase subunit A
MAELVLRGGRVIDPSQNLDGIADVVFADGKVKAAGRDAPHGRDAEVRDAKGLIVTSTRRRSRAKAAPPPSWMPAAPGPETFTVSAST